MGMRNLLAASAAALVLTACGSGNTDTLVTGQKFVAKINEMNGGHGRGDFRVVKTDSDRAGYVVFFNSARNEYEAIDMAELRARGYSPDTAARDYLNGGFRGFGEDVVYVGGGKYEGVSTRLLYEETTGSELDVLYAAKMAENLQVQATARNVAAQYGLSEEQGLRVSRLALNWEKLTESREMTVSDLNSFSQELFGINVQEIKNAAISASQGDNSAKDALILEASQALETTPENAQNILVDFIN